MLKDTYEIVSCIAQTSHSKVLLVKHKLLNQLRVAKVIECNDMRVIQEANIIKLLRHPKIPIIYDILEDNNSICIIEEYIAGKSLSEYFENNKVLFEQIIAFGIQICDVLQYIHNYNNGIIHMDLKPDNIIVDGNNNIRIIDFDNSIFKGQRIDKNYGSIGFASPEQYHKKMIDCTADIYSLGMLLLYMVNHSNIQSNYLSPVIDKCIRHNSFQRFHNVEAVKKALERLDKNYTKNNKSVNKKSQNIYIYAIRHGLGATHISLSLASYISRNGYKVLLIGNGYEDDLTSEAIKGDIQKDGSFLLYGVNIITRFSENVDYDCGNVDKYDYKIYDCGVITKDIITSKDNTLNVLVIDDGYKKKMCDKMINGLSDDVIIAVNHSDGESFYQFVKEYDSRNKFLRIPCIYKWYEKNALFDNTAWDLLNEASEGHFNIKPNKSYFVKLQKRLKIFLNKFILKI